jgi:hypothetical protein
LSLLLLLAACTNAPTAEEERAAAEAAAEAIVIPDPAAPAPVAGSAGPPEVAAEPVQVVLVRDGIGQLHKGFFSDQEAVTELATDLAGHLKPPADVHIRYDSQELMGSIKLRLAPDALVAPVAASGEKINLQALAPITTALASYRSNVAARFDFRVESFRVGIESYRGHRICQLSLAGPPPPDGALISPCVDINGHQHCGESAVDGVTFSTEAAEHLRACFDTR